MFYITAIESKLRSCGRKKKVLLAAREAETLRRRFLFYGGWWSPWGYADASFLCSVFLWLQGASAGFENIGPSSTRELSTTSVLKFCLLESIWQAKEFLRKSSPNDGPFHVLRVHFVLWYYFCVFWEIATLSGDIQLKFGIITNLF